MTQQQRKGGDAEATKLVAVGMLVHD